MKARTSDCEILFVGAEGRMEMGKVPAARYRIEGLPIAGLQRKLTVKNILFDLTVPFKMLRSQRMVRSILRNFQPDIVVGVGGYASAPTLKTAEKMGLRPAARTECSRLTKELQSAPTSACYEGLDEYFPAEKIVFTGNPVRAAIEEMTCTRQQGCEAFALDAAKPVVLSVGGSLGASSINRMIMQHLEDFKTHDIQLIWQTGQWMFDEAQQAVQQAGVEQWVKVHQFISHMELAYSRRDAVHAGAIAYELCLVGQPVIFLPPRGRRHQPECRALADQGAASLYLSDAMKGFLRNEYNDTSAVTDWCRHPHVGTTPRQM